MTLVDSDILIRFLRGDRAAAARLQAVQAMDTLACSVITSFEVLRGATAAQLEATEALIYSLVELPVTAAVAGAAAAEYRRFRSENVTLAMPDLLIGCTARVSGASLLAGNKKHYPISGLVLLTV